ncbi:MAG TPA: transcription elongation factor GreA [bacterium]|nr:transcription elongation factor GreA [bacterium]
MATYPITTRGYAAIKKELDHLKKVDRPAIIKAIAEARSHGDLSENAEYHAAKERQGFIEGRIKNLEGIVATAEVIDPAGLSGERVLFGATVTLFDLEKESEMTYQVVGEVEADLNKGKISVRSPIGGALIGREVGDEVTVQTPSGARKYEIVSVKFV